MHGTTNLITLVQKDFNTGGVQKIFGILANGIVSDQNQVEVLVYNNEGPWRQHLDPRVSVWELTPGRNVGGRLAALRSEPRLLAQLFRPILMAPRVSETLKYLTSFADYLAQRRPVSLLTATPYINVEAVLARSLAHSNARLVLSERTHLTESVLSSSQRKNRRWHRRHLGPLIRKAYNKADAIIAISQGVADDLADIGVESDKIHVVYNPVIGPNFAERLDQPATHPWANDKSVPLLLFVGRFAPQKDLPTLLKAHAIVLTRRRPVRLLLVGGSAELSKFGMQQRRIFEMASQLCVREYVDVIGFEDNPLPYMRECSVFVLPSRFEGFGNVLVEALAAGATVVSTDCPSGPSEILDGGRFGQLVPVGDAEALAVALLEALDSPRDKAGRDDWLRRFRSDVGVEQYMGIMQPVEAA
jgi:glycosyltransferase involved in cell wall biosynthesis